MKLHLVRFAFGYDATIGVLKVDGEPRWFVLEDEDRLMAQLPKIPGRTAIPTGSFQLRVKPWSPKFKRAVVEILEIPYFSDVYFHPGNTDLDTAGCLLPAMRADLKSWSVIKSTPAVEEIFALVEKDAAQTLTISRAPMEPGELRRLKRRWMVDYLKKEERT